MSIYQQSKRKLTALLICGLLIFLLTAFSSGTSGYYEDFEYEVISESDKTCAVVDYDGNAGALTIPSKMNGYTVVMIDDDAFYGADITSISLPSTVKTIGEEAFGNCDKLKKITLPDSITSIEDGAFTYCSSLTSVKLPAKLTTVSYKLFYNCKSLKSVTLSSKVKAIDSFAFNGCSALTTINYPNSLVSIGSYAFSNCSSLTSIDIPAKMSSIEERTFSNSGLEKLVIPANIRTIGQYAFSDCQNLKNVVIKNGTQTVGFFAFSSCDNLEFISVPKSVTEWDSAIAFNTKAKVHGLKGSYIEEELGDSSRYSRHTFTKKVVKPTCAEGYTKYSCECGYSYKSSYVDATKKHTTVTIKAVKATKTTTGKTAGSYCSTCKKVFKESKTVAKIKTVALSAEKVIYTGKTRKPKVQVTDTKGNTISSSYYTVTYPSKSVDVGQYTVKVTFKGKYSGTETLTYRIVPKGTSFTKVTRISNGLNLQFKEQTTKTSGYRIQYARKKDFSDAKTVTIADNKTVKKTVKELVDGKTYYLRVQTYKNVKISGETKKIGSAWSDTVKVVAAKSIGKFYKQTEEIPFLVNESYYSDELSVVYEMPYASATRVHCGLRITKEYPGYHPYKITFYRATSKDGTYKKITPQTNNWYDKYLVIYDEEVASNKKYYYKVNVLYVPEDCDTEAEFKKLSATEKIYDETITAESFYTAMKPIRDQKTSGSTMKWSAVKGATGYKINERVVEKLGYNIFGNPVYGHYKTENISKTNSVKSRVKSNTSSLRGASLFYDVYPYVKRGDYYYCDGEPVAKKIEYEKKISFNKHA